MRDHLPTVRLKVQENASDETQSRTSVAPLCQQKRFRHPRNVVLFHRDVELGQRGEVEVFRTMCRMRRLTTVVRVLEEAVSRLLVVDISGADANLIPFGARRTELLSLNVNPLSPHLRRVALLHTEIEKRDVSVVSVSSVEFECTKQSKRWMTPLSDLSKASFADWKVSHASNPGRDPVMLCDVM